MVSMLAQGFVQTSLSGRMSYGSAVFSGCVEAARFLVDRVWMACDGS